LLPLGEIITQRFLQAGVPGSATIVQHLTLWVVSSAPRSRRATGSCSRWPRTRSCRKVAGDESSRFYARWSSARSSAYSSRAPSSSSRLKEQPEPASPLSYRRGWRRSFFRSRSQRSPPESSGRRVPAGAGAARPVSGSSWPRSCGGTRTCSPESAPGQASPSCCSPASAAHRSVHVSLQAAAARGGPRVAAHARHSWRRRSPDHLRAWADAGPIARARTAVTRRQVRLAGLSPRTWRRRRHKELQGMGRSAERPMAPRILAEPARTVAMASLKRSA
jgi:hypothetical protein